MIFLLLFYHYINKLNIDISKSIITKCCVKYKSIKTGLFIYLFNLNNINIKNGNKTIFEIDAYSFCPINDKIKFQIVFNKSIANCFFNHSYSIVKINLKTYKTKKILKATCLINEQIKNLDEYYFPVAKSNYTLHINISNKRKYLSLIFQNFYCKNSFKCSLFALSYKNRKKGYKIYINIYNRNYICILNNKVNYLNNNIPIISNFSCQKSILKYNCLETIIAGIKFKKYNRNKNIIINNIPNQFIISQIIIENEIDYSLIIIKVQIKIIVHPA